MIGHNGHEVVETIEAMGLQYEACYYDDDVTLASAQVYGVDGCDSYEYECNGQGVIVAEGEFFHPLLC